MAVEQRRSWRRTINRRLQLASVLFGITLVYSNLIFFWEHHVQVAAVTTGMMVLLTGLWYAGSPMWTSERRYLGFREELGGFLSQARKLNAAAVDGHGAEEIQSIASAMHESIGRLTELAGKVDVPR